MAQRLAVLLVLASIAILVCAEEAANVATPNAAVNPSAVDAVKKGHHGHKDHNKDSYEKKDSYKKDEYKKDEYKKDEYKKETKYEHKDSKYDKYEHKDKYDDKKDYDKYSKDSKYEKYDKYEHKDYDKYSKDDKYEKYDKYDKYSESDKYGKYDDKYGKYDDKYSKYDKYDDKYSKYEDYDKYSKYEKYDKYSKYDDKYSKYGSDYDKYDKYSKYEDKYSKYDSDYDKYDKYGKYEDKYGKYEDKYSKYEDKYSKYGSDYDKYDKYGKYEDKYSKYDGYKGDRYYKGDHYDSGYNSYDSGDYSGGYSGGSDYYGMFPSHMDWDLQIEASNTTGQNISYPNIPLTWNVYCPHLEEEDEPIGTLVIEYTEKNGTEVKVKGLHVKKIGEITNITWTPDAEAVGNCSKKTKSLKSINVVKPISVTHFTARVASTLDYDGKLAEIATSKKGYKKDHHKKGHREYYSGDSDDYYGGRHESEGYYGQGGDYMSGKHTQCANIILAHGKIELTFEHKGKEIDFIGKVSWILNFEPIDPPSGSSGPSGETGDYGYGYSYGHNKVDDSPCHDRRPTFPVNTLNLKLKKDDESEYY